MKISREVKIGLIFLLALALFIWGFNYLKGKDIFKHERKFYAVYDRIDGLVPANAVYINGKQIGFVDDVYFLPDWSGKIVVSFIVTEKFPIPSNSVARIYSADLMGSKSIEIKLGSSNIMAENGDTLAPDIETGLIQEVNKQILPLKMKAENLMLSIDSVLAVIQAIFNESTRENLGKSFESIKITIDNLKNTTFNIDTLLESQKNRLSRIIGNFESITANIANNSDFITNIIRNLSNLSDTVVRANVGSTLKNLKSAIYEFDDVIGKINRGEGSLGLLLNNDSLYNKLESSSKNLDLLLEDVRLNPHRYLHFSIFGRNPKKNAYKPPD